MGCYPGPMTATFRFIDLCAGIGGLRIPFDSGKGGLNGECVFTAEIDPAAKLTYARNFTTSGKTVQETIEEISNDLVTLDPDQVPDHDLLMAGFPCQPFSHAGLRQGFGDDRGGIFQKIAQIVASKRPKVVLLENVRGLTTLRNPDGSLVLNEIIQELREPKEDLRYIVPKPQLLNARDFGLAQNRVRLFIIAIRSDVAELEGISEDNFRWPEPTHNRDELKVADFLDTDVAPSFTISDKLWAGHLARKERNTANGKGWGYQLFTRDSKYVATISARYFKDGSEALIGQDGDQNPRKLTPNEARKLQGFPEDFIVHESKMQAFKQFGNAVPVNVISAIARTLKPILD